MNTSVHLVKENALMTQKTYNRTSYRTYNILNFNKDKVSIFMNTPSVLVTGIVGSVLLFLRQQRHLPVSICAAREAEA